MPHFTPQGLDTERVIGRHGEPGAAALLLVTAGIHGNEPAGVLALRRVLAQLAATKQTLRGELVALAGNRAALAKGVRYVDEDLNRLWSTARVAELATAPANVERREQRELLTEIERTLATKRDRVLVLDLHSTSGGGPPFSLMGDTLQNRTLAFALGVPVLLGLEENVEGTLLEYFGERGIVSVVLEGGQNQAPATVDHHESAVWIALVSSGLLRAEEAPALDSHRARLAQAGSGLPSVVEVLYRHELEEGEDFRMLPGLASFQAIEKNRLLAHSGANAERQVLAPFGGVLLMPRYQGQGLDGFFMGKSIDPLWLSISAWMRRMRLERVVSTLPGVRVVDKRSSTLEVDERVARFFSNEFFHLLGYRKRVARDKRLVFSRRVEKPV